MSELDVLVDHVVPVAVTAVGTYGAAVLSRAENEAVEATARLGHRILARLAHRDAKRIELAVADLAKEPGSAGARQQLRWQISQILGEDEQLRKEIAALLPTSSVTQTAGDRSVNIKGSNHGIVSTGDGAFIVQNK